MTTTTDIKQYLINKKSEVFDEWCACKDGFSLGKAQMLKEILNDLFNVDFDSI